MNDTSIYKLILIFSTTYFIDRILDSCNPNRERLNTLCIKYTKLIIDDGDNYYLNANFSSKKIIDIEEKFFKEVGYSFGNIENSILLLSFYSLKIQHRKLLKKREKYAMRNHITNLIEEFYLYCLENKDLKVKFLYTNELDYLISDKYLNISEKSWINSNNKFDQYIIKIMGDLPEVVFDYYLDMIELPFFKLYPYLIVKEDIQQNINFYDSICKLSPKDNFYNSEKFVRDLLFQDLENINNKLYR